MLTGAFPSEEFHNLSLLQNQTFTSLDVNLQQNIEVLLHRLIDMYNKLEEVLAMHKKSLDASKIKALAEKGKNEVKRDMDVNNFVLASLRFPTIRHREEAICEAHQRTFSWIFGSCQQETANTRPWSNFVDWLSEDGGIYWINGKAGSGKSTLMKYIRNHENTLKHLHSWASGTELQVARFYFFNGGNEDQRSHTGLLRSLLHGILSQRTDLIRQVFQEEWNETRKLADQVEKFKEPPKWSWSFAELEKALADLQNASAGRFKLCLFIDGLDEYEGDSEAVVGLFDRLSRSSHIKVCLSSRPWLVFEETLGYHPGLRLQDLTYNDIRTFVQDKLDANPKMLQLIRSNPLEAAQFSKTVVSKANGVFLWVRLVVVSLLNGLRNRDEMSDMQKRLELIPSELDDLYGHMLNRIEPMYHEQASQIFQIFNAARDFALQPTALELEIALSSTFAQAMGAIGNPMSEEEMRTRSLRMRDLLKSRCEGLLEVHEALDKNWESVDDSIDAINLVENQSLQRGNALTVSAQALMVEWKVSYLHRTVKDYLQSEEVRTKLQRTTTGGDLFDPNLALLQSYVVGMKRGLCFRFFYSFDRGRTCWQAVWITVGEAFLYAGKVSSASKQRCCLLQELNVSSYHWYHHPSQVLTGLSYPNTGIPKIAPRRWRRNFFFEAICFGLEDYLQTYLEPSNVDINLFLKCALGMPVEPPNISMRLPKKKFLSPSIVHLLIQRGADPNGFYPQNAMASTIWQLFLYSLYDEGYVEKFDVDVQAENNNTNIDVYELKIKAAMAEVLLRGGANPRVELTQLGLLYPSARGLPTMRTVIADIFGRRCLSQEAALLLDVLKDAESENQHTWQSTSRKAVREEPRKRPWDHDSRETMNDYYGSRARPVSL